MTVSLNTDTITLSGPCGVEEVETLVGYLESQPGLSVDISAAKTIHTALWQALMVFRPHIVGTPMSSLIVDRLLPALNVYLDETCEPLVKLAESSLSQ